MSATAVAGDTPDSVEAGPVESVQDRLAEQVRALLLVHPRTKQADPASEAGLFAGERRPLVVDANVFYGEVLRLARDPGDTKLLTLARLGFLHVLVAQHVADEVDEHLEEWSRARGLSYETALHRWTDDLRPIITVVDLPISHVVDLLTTAETERVTVLAESHRRSEGDGDDVPTAVLALILQAPLLSKDAAPLRAVYGTETGRDLHADYLKALTAGGQVHIVQESMKVSLLIGGVTTTGAVNAIRSLSRRTGALPLVIAGAVLTAATVNHGRRQGWDGVRRLSEQVGKVLLEMAEFYADAEARFAELVKPQTSNAESSPARSDLRRDILDTSQRTWTTCRPMSD